MFFRRLWLWLFSRFKKPVPVLPPIEPTEFSQLLVKHNQEWAAKESERKEKERLQKEREQKECEAFFTTERVNDLLVKIAEKLAEEINDDNDRYSFILVNCDTLGISDTARHYLFPEVKKHCDKLGIEVKDKDSYYYFDKASVIKAIEATASLDYLDPETTLSVVRTGAFR